MKTLIALGFLTPCLSFGETLRLSHVVSKPGEGITQFEFGSGDEKQTVFVKDEPIVTEAEIAIATPSPSRKDAIDISLNEEGAEKMTAATGKMRPGIDRVAIIIDGKVISAPVLQSVPLGKNFIISGLADLENHEPEKLAARLSGKSEEKLMRELKRRTKIENFYQEANEGKGNLRFLFPEVDPTAPTNFVTLTEQTKLELEDKTQSPTTSDYKKIIAALYQAASIAEKDSSSADCDFLKFISQINPEIEALVKESTGGRIPLVSIRKALEPYILGDKPLP